MKYLCLVYPPENFHATPEVVRQFRSTRQAMADAGVFLAAGQLQPVSSATTVRVRDGETLLTDGPFAEIKEQVGGYVLLDCPDLDDALRWAATLPGVQGGGAEVRPLVEFPD